MTIMNRRNAVLGYLVITTGKVVARRKAKQVGGKLAPPWGGNDTKSTKRGKKQSARS